MNSVNSQDAHAQEPRTRKKYVRTRKTLERRSDEHFLRRWKELGYDKQEREYYANPLIYAPTTSSCIARFAETGRSGAKLVLQAVKDVKIP